MPERTREKRAEELKKLQERIIEKHNASLVGKTVKVIYDDIDYDRQAFVGRTQSQAPDIDNVVYFTSADEVKIGNFYDVEIVGSTGVDLVGRVKQ